MYASLFISLAVLARHGVAQAPTAITVSSGGSINSAIAAAQNSAIPTVAVQPGTYSEVLTIQGTQTVTIAGPSATGGYAANQVVIQASAPSTGVLTFNTQKSLGITVRNINITNLAGAGNVRAPAVSMYGSNMAFYDVALVSAGAGVYTASLGTTLIANSYIEGSDKLFYNYITAYVYNSTIVPTAPSASIFYGQGYQINNIWYNASLVVDSSSVIAKPGSSNTYVYLAQPNGNYTQAVYRGTYFGSLMAPAALRTGICSYITTYGEFASSGPGGMSASNTASRNAVCDLTLTSDQVSSFTVDKQFGRGFAGYASSDTTWIDASVLGNIKAADAAQLAAVPSSSTSQSTTSATTTSSTTASSTSMATSSVDQSSSSTTTPSSTSQSTTIQDSSAASPSITSPSSISASTASTTTTSSTTSAVTVALDGSGAYTDVNAAVSYAQNNKIATVTIQAGTYAPVTITGTQTITLVGPTATAVSANQAVIAGSGTNAALTIGTSNTLGSTYRYINFTNSGTSGVASAVSARGINLAFYSCALVSSAQAVYSASYGITIMADSYIEGTDKLFYNYPTVYLYRSTIVPTASGASILYSKGAVISGQAYNATLIVDSSAVSQKPGSAASGVWLATPNGLNNYTVAIYRNTSIASLVAPGGVYASTCQVISTSGEFLTTGAGSYSNNAAARAANCDQSLSTAQVSSYTIDKVFASAFAPYANTDSSWIDDAVLNAITSGTSAQIASGSSSVTTSGTSTSSGPTTSVSPSASSGSSTDTASTTTSSPSTCATPTPGATLVVSQNATGCEYANITSAITALPNDSKAYTISIKAGVYNEQISITRNGKVTLIGETNFVNDYTQNKVKIQFSRGVLTSAGQNELTPVIYSKKTNDNSGLALYNIDFVNSYPQTANTAALAADFYGNAIAAYGCSFVGFQDTLLANKGTQVFSNCYIEGSVDFVWGFSTAYFHQCYVATNTKGTCIAAQSRTAGTVSGYVFDSCYVTYTSSYGTITGQSYLGRPYNSFSTVVYMNSFLDSHINAAGWSVWQTNNPQTSNVTFGEYNNTGAGSWQAGTARAPFATNLTADQAAVYSLSSWIGDTSFIDQVAYNYRPSYSWNVTSTSSGAPSTTTGSISTATATVNAHPDSGTEPPQYAVLVSSGGSINGSFSNVTAALASLPNDNTNQTIFIYPGTYTEQVSSINRPGAVRIIGYTSALPGRSYKDNQVAINFARGLSVSPLPAGHSDAETAVVSTASNAISFYNIAITNTDNLNGLEASYVTLAASIYGSRIAFYACSFNGWQDTLLTGSTNGYQYYESCYIGGAIDFIWGYSKAYFKGCTIGAKRAKSAVTAHSRASLTAVGGYIFDQCLFTAAPDNTADLAQQVYLGRPYSAYALVVIKNSYLDSIIQPSGWKVWSATDPRTDHVTFAELNNTGPGNWENNAAARLAFGNCTLLTSDTYSLSSVMDSTAWIDMTYWNSIVTPQPTIVNTTTSSNTTVSGNSTYDGTTPPPGALIVSKTPVAGQTVYNTIQAALDAAPISSKTNATIFIYPGVYEEKLIVNKSGTTVFKGYSSDTDDYNQNQVTIQQSYGVDTQGDGSDVDAATVYATGNYFSAYNINFRNNNGTQQNIASLGFAVKSSKYAFLHACQVYGNQDTLYINGYFFAFKSYIEGNVDFIFGSGSGYFLNSTISPNEDRVAITADKRTTNTTQAGMVFDQSTIVPANGFSGFTNVSLGRPWNNNSRVLYTLCYLDGMIGQEGWTWWSKSSPQTDGVAYYERNNYGPGSNTCKRATFSSQLSADGAVAFQLANFFPSTTFIDFSVLDVQPFTPDMGTSPAGCATVPTSTISTVSSTSTPLITVFVTKTTTQRLTSTITATSADTTIAATSVITQNNGVTITPAPVLKTSIVKSTIYETATSTQAGKTSTLKSTETIIATTTISGKASTAVVDITEYQTYTVTGKASTVSSTQTITSLITSSPKAVTSTHVDLITSTTTIFGKDSTVLSTITNVQTINAIPATTTIKTTLTSSFTITSAPAPATVSSNIGGTSTSFVTSSGKVSTVTSTAVLPASTITKTSSVKASTTTAFVTSVKSVTKSTTITGTCTPAARLLRRGLAARAAGTITSTIIQTVSSIVSTSTYLQKGATISTVILSTTTISPTTTLKAVTSTVVSTSLATSIQTFVVSADSVTITSLKQVTSTSTLSLPGQANTITSTIMSGTTITFPGSTSTSIAYKTTTQTITAPASTIIKTVGSTSISTLSIPGTTITSTKSIASTTTISAPPVTSISSKVVSLTRTVTGAQQTVTQTYSSDVIIKSTTVVPGSTATVTKTSSAKAVTSVATITPAPVTKTSTIKRTETQTRTVTKAGKSC